MAESSLNPLCTTGLAKTGIPKHERYVELTDSGQHDFANDMVAFGLVQWRYWSRKQGLLDYAQSQGKSVGDAKTQLEYMWKELQSYKTVLYAVTGGEDIKTVSDIFMLKYERPAGTSETAKNKRSNYAQKFYDKYAASDVDIPKKMVLATSNVNLRTGDSTAYAKVGSIAKGTKYEWVATSTNGWYAIRYRTYIYWVSNSYTELTT
jgi:uncharacterized protein YgiM (DUF1202 family)